MDNRNHVDSGVDLYNKTTNSTLFDIKEKKKRKSKKVNGQYKN